MKYIINYVFSEKSYTMQNNYPTESYNDPVVTTVSHLRKQEMQNNEKATENTCLTSNNQTYFADERVHIPEVENVVYIDTNGG